VVVKVVTSGSMRRMGECLLVVLLDGDGDLAAVGNASCFWARM
jgi:hypothetical protein